MNNVCLAGTICCGCILFFGLWHLWNYRRLLWKIPGYTLSLAVFLSSTLSCYFSMQYYNASDRHLLLLETSITLYIKRIFILTMVAWNDGSPPGRSIFWSRFFSTTLIIASFPGFFFGVINMDDCGDGWCLISKASLMGEYIPQICLMMFLIIRYLTFLLSIWKGNIWVNQSHSSEVRRYLNNQLINILILLSCNFCSFLFSINGYPLWVWPLVTAVENITISFEFIHFYCARFFSFICPKRRNVHLRRNTRNRFIQSLLLDSPSPSPSLNRRLTSSSIDADLETVTTIPIVLSGCGPTDTPVEHRGVTFRYFINWAIWYHKQYPGTKTRDLVTNFITPETRDEKGPYWIKIPHEERGRPHVFISHAWDMRLKDLIEALIDWRSTHVKHGNFCVCCCKGFRRCNDFCSKNLSFKICQDPILWLDILAIPQNKGFHNENDVQKLDSTIRSIGQVALCTDLNFTPLTRSWCLFELANARRFHARITIAVCTGFKDRWLITRKVAQSIDAENGKTGNPEDKVMIDNLIIEQFETFKNLDNIVKSLLVIKLDISPYAIGGFALN